MSINDFISVLFIVSIDSENDIEYRSANTPSTEKIYIYIYITSWRRRRCLCKSGVQKEWPCCWRNERQPTTDDGERFGSGIILDLRISPIGPNSWAGSYFFPLFPYCLSFFSPLLIIKNKTISFIILFFF